MITINQTAGNDNELIWVFEIELDGSTLYYATRPVTLSSQLYSGTVLFKDSFSGIGKQIDISYGGNIGSVGFIEIGIANYSGTFFDDFYPSTGKPYLSARVIKCGVVWEGADNQNQITWIFKGFIEDYAYNNSILHLSNPEYAELESVQIPYYEVQKSFDNKVSYFPQSPEDSIGKAIPVVYGEFFTWDGQYNNYNLAPTILVEQSISKFIIASHKCHTIGYNHLVLNEYEVFKYVPSLNAYMACYKELGTVGVNTEAGHTITMQDVLSGILGDLYIQLKEISSTSDVLDVTNITDKSSVTYTELTTNGGGTYRVGLRVGSVGKSSEIGALAAIAGTDTIQIYFSISSDAAAVRNFRIIFRNPELPVAEPSQYGGYTDGSVNSTTFVDRSCSFAIVTLGKKDTEIWTIEELCGLDYILINQNTGAGEKIRIRNSYLQLNKIRVNTLKDETKRRPVIRVRNHEGRI